MSSHLFTAAPADVAELQRALSERPLLVVALCAQWCGTCREFRPALERVAASRSDITLVWLDIEDDAELAGDIDVEDFPALAVFAGRQPLHFGTTLPHEALVARLLQALNATSVPIVVPAEVARLPAALAQHVAARTRSD